MKRMKIRINLNVLSCFWAAFSFLLGLSLKGQYHITAVSPITGFTEQDVWNTSVLGPLKKAHHRFELQLDIYESTGQKVWSGQTGQFYFSTASLHISRMRLQEVNGFQRQWIAPHIESLMLEQGGSFPLGAYKFHYRLHGYHPQEGKTYNLAETVLDVESGASFPAQLIRPFDMDSIIGASINFSWSPPLGIGKIRVSQEFVLVPVYEGQSAAQAILANPAHYRQKDMLQNALYYHPGLPPLRHNQWYAWQVLVYVNGVPSLRSEAWQFILPERKSQPCEPKPAELFYEMAKKPSSYYIPVDGGQLDIQFNEKYAVSHEYLRFEIVNTRGKVVADNRTLAKPFGVGFNKFSLLISHYELDLPLGYYMLLVYGEKGEKWYLRFENKSQTNPCK